MNAGDAVKFGWSDHLWIVISDPEQNRDEVLLVNLSSVKPGRPFDPACLVRGGDHIYVRKETFVYYRMAITKSNADLEKMISAGQADVSRYPPLSDNLLDRIRRGAGTSRFIANKYRQLLIDQGLI